jgi:hypothetical protein
VFASVRPVARLPELCHKSSAEAREVMQRVVAAKLTGLTQNVAIITHLVAESGTTCNFGGIRPGIKKSTIIQ